MSNKLNIPFHRSWSPTSVRSHGLIMEVIDNGFIGGDRNSGYVVEFENKIVDYLERDQLKVVATNSGTSALYLMIRTFLGEDKHKDGYVIVPDITFPASANSVLASGLKVLLVDVDNNLQLDLEAVIEVVNNFEEKEKILAVMPVHYGGSLFPEVIMREMLDAAGREDIMILTDGAHSFGSSSASGKLVYSDACALSFHATKPLGIGEGGAMLIDSNLHSELDFEARTINWHGVDLDWCKVGLKTTMPNLNALIGCLMIDEFNEKLIVTSKFRRFYELCFTENMIEEFVKLIPINVSDSSNALVVAKFEDAEVAKLFVKELRLKGVVTSHHFPPLSISSMCAMRKDVLNMNCKNSIKSRDKLVSLPIYPDLNVKVFDCIDETLDKIRRTI